MNQFMNPLAEKMYRTYKPVEELMAKEGIARDVRVRILSELLYGRAEGNPADWFVPAMNLPNRTRVEMDFPLAILLSVVTVCVTIVICYILER